MFLTLSYGPGLLNLMAVKGSLTKLLGNGALKAASPGMSSKSWSILNWL